MTIDHLYKHKIKVQAEEDTVLTTLLRTYAFSRDKEDQKSATLLARLV